MIQGLLHQYACLLHLRDGRGIQYLALQAIGGRLQQDPAQRQHGRVEARRISTYAEQAVGSGGLLMTFRRRYLHRQELLIMQMMLILIVITSSGPQRVNGSIDYGIVRG